MNQALNMEILTNQMAIIPLEQDEVNFFKKNT